MLLLFLLEENSLENKPLVVEDFCSFSETTCLFTFRGGARKQERGMRETFQSQRVRLREGLTENTRERERERCFLVYNLFHPRARGTKAEQNFRCIKCAGGKKEVKSEILFLSKTAYHLLVLMLFPLRAMR